MCTASSEGTVVDKLASQLSYYFSDANLGRDQYLLRQTGPRGTGEVEVACLASFNRVRASRSTSWSVAHNSARSAHASRLDFVRETYFSMIFNVAKQCLVARHERCRRVKGVGPK